MLGDERDAIGLERRCGGDGSIRKDTSLLSYVFRAVVERLLSLAAVGSFCRGREFQLL